MAHVQKSNLQGHTFIGVIILSVFVVVSKSRLMLNYLYSLCGKVPMMQFDSYKSENVGFYKSLANFCRICIIFEYISNLSIIANTLPIVPYLHTLCRKFAFIVSIKAVYWYKYSVVRFCFATLYVAFHLKIFWTRKKHIFCTTSANSRLVNQCR